VRAVGVVSKVAAGEIFDGWRETIPAALTALANPPGYPHHIITMDRVLEFAVELAFESGRIQKKQYQKRHSIFHKRVGDDRK